MDRIVRIAIPSPLRRTFDYLFPENFKLGDLTPGMRLKVPFGRSTMIGVLLEVTHDSRVDASRLKPVLAVLDEQPLLPPDLLALMTWASAYYHYPIGEAILGALPARLRQGHASRINRPRVWRLTAQGMAIHPSGLTRAPRQEQLLTLLHRYPHGLQTETLKENGQRDVMRDLAKKGWVEASEQAATHLYNPISETPPDMNAAQRAAVASISIAQGFQTFLLDGVTGSGKTEVYLRIIEQVLARGMQALVLVPEIGLTPQLVERFRRRLSTPIAVLHSALGDRERLQSWLRAREGSVGVVIGTRSAVFTPLLKPGIFIIDEEHDLSLKQQDGFRYHARDVAILRARQAGIPIVLGSATPSLESLHNCQQGNYLRLVLPERAGAAQTPPIDVVDLRQQAMEGNLSQALLKIIDHHLPRGEQVLLFLNRRGYAPTFLCHACAWAAVCARCDAHLVMHRGARSVLRCHHCAAEQHPPERCPNCAGVDLRTQGYGTERVEQTLARRYPAVTITRIDRDSTRRKGALEAMLDSAQTGSSQILIGTQMLAKGHHLPDVTLVGILDADQGLFGADFRASERMAQIIVQVAGRAGRSLKPGRVVIQTHYPDHPLLRTLIDEGYPGFAVAALRERSRTQLPPYTYLALLRAEAIDATLPESFLRQAQQQLQDAKNIQIWGPVPAPMERRAGRYRAQLWIQAQQRADLHKALRLWMPRLEALKLGRKVRWSLDIDPMETL